MSPAKKKALGVGFAVFLLAFWEVLALLIHKSYLLPTPVQVLAHIWENRAELFAVHLPATMLVAGIGFVLSVVTGCALALLMDLSRHAERAIYPVLTVTQTIPVMCLAPVFVLWLGYSVPMRVLVVVLLNFFSVAVNVFDGLKSTSIGRSELMASYGAGRLQQFFCLRLPTALPYFFASLKIAVPWSVVGAAVAEWLGAPGGMGTYSRARMMELDAAGLLAPLLILTVIALALHAVLQLIERRVITWKGEV